MINSLSSGLEFAFDIFGGAFKGIELLWASNGLFDLAKGLSKLIGLVA